MGQDSWHFCSVGSSDGHEKAIFVFASSTGIPLFGGSMSGVYSLLMLRKSLGDVENHYASLSDRIAIEVTSK